MFQSVWFEKFASFIGHGYDALKLLEPRQVVAGVIRTPEILHDALGGRVDPAAGNDVVRERHPGRRVRRDVQNGRGRIVNRPQRRRRWFSDFEKSPVRSRSVGMVRIASLGSLVRQPS